MPFIEPMKIRILPEAEGDLDDGYWFYESLADGLGEYFLSSISSDIRSLGIFAGVHQVIDEKFRMVASRFPYSIFYEVTESEVRIYAVIDNRRDPEWISERLS
jgi:plasmid stabilization system protein ParE